MSVAQRIDLIQKVVAIPGPKEEALSVTCEFDKICTGASRDGCRGPGGQSAGRNQLPAFDQPISSCRDKAAKRQRGEASDGCPVQDGLLSAIGVNNLHHPVCCRGQYSPGNRVDSQVLYIIGMFAEQTPLPIDRLSVDLTCEGVNHLTQRRVEQRGRGAADIYKWLLETIQLVGRGKCLRIKESEPAF